jgi:ketosteroid isomerase-like protein
VSQENIDLVRRFLDAAVRRDLPAVLDCFDPEVEFIPVRAATEGVFHGHAGIERFLADNRASFDLFEPDYELREAGERVLALGTVRLRGRGSGVEMNVPSAGVIDIRDGRIVRWRDFGSVPRALQEAGA